MIDLLIRCRHIISVSMTTKRYIMRIALSMLIKRYRHRVTDSDGFVNTRTMVKNNVETMNKLWLIFYWGISHEEIFENIL